MWLVFRLNKCAIIIAYWRRRQEVDKLLTIKYNIYGFITKSALLTLIFLYNCGRV